MGNHVFSVTVATRVRGADGKMNTVKQSILIDSAKTEREAEELIRRRLTEFGFNVGEVEARRATPQETRRLGSAPAFTMKRSRNNGRRAGGFFGFK